MLTNSQAIRGAGLGLRRDFLAEVCEEPPANIDFYEVAPENWINIGGRLGKQFQSLRQRGTLICHGLSLSLGSPADLDFGFLRQLKAFLDANDVAIYSEHLSYCSDEGHLYDLLPIPFTGEAVKYVAQRIRTVQDVLDRRIAIENVSYYAEMGKELEETDFLKAVLAEADCDLLLDINNVYVNSVNHGYDATQFIDQIPASRIAYGHVAGHYRESDDLIVDTHGAPVVDPVWALLDYAYDRLGVFPTLLERDFNIPPLRELLTEVDAIRAMQEACGRNALRRYA